MKRLPRKLKKKCYKIAKNLEKYQEKQDIDLTHESPLVCERCGAPKESIEPTLIIGNTRIFNKIKMPCNCDIKKNCTDIIQYLTALN